MKKSQLCGGAESALPQDNDIFIFISPDGKKELVFKDGELRIQYRRGGDKNEGITNKA